MPNAYRGQPQTEISIEKTNAMSMSDFRKDLDFVDASLTGKAQGEEVKASDLLRDLASLRDKANFLRISIPDDVYNFGQFSKESKKEG